MPRIQPNPRGNAQDTTQPKGECSGYNPTQGGMLRVQPNPVGNAQDTALAHSYWLFCHVTVHRLVYFCTVTQSTQSDVWASLHADLYTPTASLDVFSRCLKRMAMGSSRLVALLETQKTTRSVLRRPRLQDVALHYKIHTEIHERTQGDSKR